MKEKFQRFMQGRYGTDQLNRCLLIVSLVLVVLAALFTRVGRIGSLLDMLGILGLFIAYFRMFSKNISQRADENRKFLEKTSVIRQRLNKEKYMMQQRKIYHIYTCPGCHQKIRAPKGKGRIEISCPKCQTKFIKNS